MKRLILLFYFVFISALSYGQENCNNGIDDDGDGNIDLNDSECDCNNPSLTSPASARVSLVPTKKKSSFL